MNLLSKQVNSGVGLIQGRTQASLIILVAVTPARRGLPSSPQQNFLAVELWHIPGETSLFSRMELCSLDILLELTVSRVSTMTHWRNVSQG